MTPALHAATNADSALTLKNITKRFGATVAVDDVSLVVRQGTVHALLGENGAGKTTLMRVAFGLLRADRGEVFVDGQRAKLREPVDAIDVGIGMVHQHFTNVGAMTVAENIALGHRGRYDTAAAADRVREIGQRAGLTLNPSARVRDLPVGAQQRLEILKALGRDVRMLILDEPTAVLAPDEAQELLRWIRAFAKSGGAVVLITHKLREALSVSDDVTVLRRGKAVLNAPAASLDAERLATELLGEARVQRQRVAISSSDEVVARIDRVGVDDDRGVATLRDATLTVRSGEIVGVAAVEGAGQRELLRVLSSRSPASRGTAEVPSDVAFVPEDRHRDAVVLDFSPSENVALKGAGARTGLVPWRALVERTSVLIAAFDVRGARPDGDGALRELSGGNQQKFVLARELDGSPKLVVAENPTRGLDIRATEDVRDRLRAAARDGAGVIVYSSDLDEVLSLATRVVVLHDGRLREVDGDRETIGRAMLGVA
ncbi:MAG TPA: ATP-binding cassette domain-containing protein [Gemmatimonadaceae bacterium]